MLDLHQNIIQNQLWDKELSFKKGALVFSKGDVTPWVFFIEKGACIITIEDAQEEKVIRLVYEHNWVSALDAFLSHKPTQFTMKTIKQTHIKAISKEHYFKLIEEEELNRNKDIFNPLLQGLIHSMMERELDLMENNPKKRIERVLQRSPQLFQQIPNKYIAKYLNMSPETLSRVLNS